MKGYNISITLIKDQQKNSKQIAAVSCYKVASASLMQCPGKKYRRRCKSENGKNLKIRTSCGQQTTAINFHVRQGIDGNWPATLAFSYMTENTPF